MRARALTRQTVRTGFSTVGFGKVKMDILAWVVAGAFAGWVGFKFIGANESRGMMVSMIIGMTGGFLGGHVLAPMLGETAPMADTFSLITLFIALASAALFLTIGDMISKRFNV